MTIKPGRQCWYPLQKGRHPNKGNYETTPLFAFLRRHEKNLNVSLLVMETVILPGCPASMSGLRMTRVDQTKQTSVGFAFLFMFTGKPRDVLAGNISTVYTKHKGYKMA